MFVIEIPYLNLNQIYNSGQAPRWTKLRDSKYIIPFKDKVLKIEQQRDRFDFNRYRFIMSCSEDEFCSIWFEYFDVRTDYMELNRQVKKLGGKFKIVANRSAGIHILRQDTFEAYVLGKLITYVGYIQARYIINHIAEVCGVKHVQSMREVGRIIWYEFPTPEMVLEKFDKLCNMGKVNAWLKKLCKAIVDDGFNMGENVMNSGNDLLKLLVLHETDKFPLNGIQDTLVKNFDCDPKEFADWYLDDVDSKGLVYMYILHHIANPPEEVVLHGVG